MNRFSLIALALVSLPGCLVGTKLSPAQLHARVGSRGGPPPPPPPPSSYASSAPSSAPSGGGPVTAALPGQCIQEFGVDAANQRARATPIEPGTFTGCVSEGDDGDMFVLTAPPSSGGVLYRIELAQAKVYYQDLYILDGDGERQHNDHGKKASIRAWAVAAGGSETYLQIARGEAYSLTVSAELLDDPDEHNDDFATATPLALNHAHQALFGPVGADEARATDVYKIELRRAGILHLDLLDSGDDARFAFEVYSTDRERIRYRWAGNDGANLREDVEIHHPGVFFIQVKPESGVPVAGEGEPPTRLLQPYTIKATLK